MKVSSLKPTKNAKVNWGLSFINVELFDCTISQWWESLMLIAGWASWAGYSICPIMHIARVLGVLDIHYKAWFPFLTM